ncbi:MAG: hypothetical protein JSS11_00280 [Verrucomicrobia bacterium]|nr:hypothetical protein [Verrucomicrobiota bacterium]
MPKPEAPPRTPADFAAFLATAKPVLVVGGQAVNLWALYYKDRTTDLAPFVSRDADVLGDRETLAEIGRVIGVKPQFFPLRPPTNEIGVVVARDVEGHPLMVEVLRSVHGATNAELREPAYTLTVGEKPVAIQVPGPIALLKAKIANVAGLHQEGRQDGRHVVILARLMPAYLHELQTITLAGQLAERRLLDYLENLLAVVAAPSARKIFAQLKLDPIKLFDELDGAKLPKVKLFLRERLPRRFPSGHRSPKPARKRS